MQFDHFWVSTAPRTGSMWVYNVLRQVLVSAGQTVLPEIVPQSDDEMLGIYNAARRSGYKPRVSYAYKTHEALTEQFVGSKIITTVRDPREMVVSYMRFMNAGFDQALGNAKLQLIFTDRYEQFRQTPVLKLRYEHIDERPKSVIRKIVEFSNISLDEGTISKIATRLDRRSVRDLIKSSDDRLREKIDSKQVIHPNEIVGDLLGAHRAFDAKTGFQTGHVSNMTKDDYRNFLTKEQVLVVNDTFGEWLDQHRYSREF